jgi:hypothetical protein
MSLLQAYSNDAYVVSYPRREETQAFSLLSQLMRLCGRGKAAVAPAARALGVASLLAGLFVAAASVPKPDVEKRAAAPRLARPPAPAATLSLAQLDDFPLDSDFSLDAAAAAWARRLSERDAAVGPDAVRFGAQRVQRSIVERVVRAAAHTGSDAALLMSIADKESSFSSKARASTSSASGLFQFVEGTWLRAMKSFGVRYGHEEEANAIRGQEEHPEVDPAKRAEILKLRNDPYLSAVLAAEMLKRDGGKLAEQLGRSLTAGETYLIHFLGPDDAAKFLAKMDAEPETSAAELLPKPARANKPIFYEAKGGKVKARSVREVHDAFERMMLTRVDRFRGVEDRLPAGATAYAEMK